MFPENMHIFFFSLNVAVSFVLGLVFEKLQTLAATSQIPQCFGLARPQELAVKSQCCLPTTYPCETLEAIVSEMIAA